MSEAAVTRVATADDIRELLVLFVQHNTAPFTDEKVNRYRERLDRLVDAWDHHLVVAEVDGRVVGYAAAQDYGPAGSQDWSIARMHDLWVATDARGHGVGSALFNAIRDWATHERSIRVLQWQSGQVAAEFYQRLGLEDASGDGTHFELEVALPSAADG